MNTPNFGLDNWTRDADVSKEPWFLEQQDDTFTQMGFPRERRVRALHGLQRLFPSEVCRTIRDKEGKYDFEPVMGLFVPCWPGMIAKLLEVGCDLDVVQPWDDGAFIERLRHRNGFPEAAFELKIHANLARAGYRVQRVPEAPGEKKTPDLIVKVDEGTLPIEAKLVNNPQLHELADFIGEKIRSYANTIEGLHLRCVGDETLTERALDAKQHNALLAEADAIAKAFSACIENIRTTGRLPGEYPAPPYGQVVATSEDGLGSVASDPLPDLPPEKRARRVVRHIKDATSHLAERRGIAVIGLFHAADPESVEMIVREQERQGSRAFGNCQSIVLCDSVFLPGESGHCPVFYAFAGSVYRRLTKTHMRLARIIAGDEIREAQFLRRARPDERGFIMNTERRRVTSRKIARVEMEPGSRVTVFFDGRPPEYGNADGE